VPANLSDSSTCGEHPASHNAPVSAHGLPERTTPPPPSRPSATNGIWLAIYALTAVICSLTAILIAQAVHAAPMETVAAGGGTFVVVLGLAMTAHRFLKDR